jgi:predicted dehydrogenase
MPESSNRDESVFNRRDFLRNAALASAGTAVAASMLEGCSQGGRMTLAPTATIPPFKPHDVVKIGFVGVGDMGTNHCANLLKIEGTELRAVCDLMPEKVAHLQQMAKAAGRPVPVGYTNGPQDFKRMCDQEELDLVYTATPWEWHVPVCVYAMKTGKNAATEVPASITIEGCWELVETAESTGRHCQMMENCCYDRSEMMVLNMVRKGLFGDLVHAEGGYLHDLREIKFSKAGELWRRAHAIKYNGNLYPTHGFGPLAWYTNLNRGDRCEYLVSMSSASKGLQAYAAEHLTADDPRRSEHFALGDVNTTIIKTIKGLTIVLQYDTNLPRPYSRINRIQGTKGIFRGFPDQIYIEGRTKNDEWESLESFRKEFEHPLWKKGYERAKGTGHGGMDFIEDYRMINALRKGLYPDMDVYDAATWSAPVGLSERSVAHRSRPVNFPDFTRGRWKTAQPIPIFEA